ncbi:MAG: DUF4190 domain-containing protein [Pyrinomonadaceae bacterium]
MKECPRCRLTYDDDQLNFCLNDGELLTYVGQTTRFGDDAPPTVLLDQSRVTNPAQWPSSPPPAPIAPWQRQNIPNRQFGAQPFMRTRDQTIPTIAMILGILSIAMACCYGGLWLGLPAAVLGFIGVKNADSDDERYGGRGMALAGIVMGGITCIISIIHILFVIFSVLDN